MGGTTDSWEQIEKLGKVVGFQVKLFAHIKEDFPFYRKIIQLFSCFHFFEQIKLILIRHILEKSPNPSRRIST